MVNCIVITDIGSVDPDDALALLLMKQLQHDVNFVGVITTHHYASDRAKLASIMMTEIGMNVPVFAHVQDDKEFKKNNILWPSLFGYPKLAMVYGDKEWFPLFLEAYRKHYDFDVIDVDESGLKFLNNELKKASKQEPLLVICLSPMHIIAEVDVELYPNMNLWAMGGGFEKDIDNKDVDNKNLPLVIQKAGYNWGICPNVTQTVLTNLTKSHTSANIISSAFVRRNNLVVPLEMYEKWKTSAKKFTKVFMQDWVNCNRGNELKQHKNIADPVTMYLACKNACRVQRMQSMIHNIDNHDNYMDEKQTIEEQLLMMTKSFEGNTQLVIDIDKGVVEEIIQMMDVVLGS